MRIDSIVRRGLEPALVVSGRLLLAAGLLAAWSGPLRADAPSDAMAAAAVAFLETLTPDLRQAAEFPLDSEVRADWQFVPMERQGAALRDMDLAQRQAAHRLLRSALSSQGYLKAAAIMSLEQLLRELEAQRPDVEEFRHPEKYWLAVFGDPGETAPWGWRIEGHHLSLNFSIVPGEGIAAAPVFFGANPAEVRSGPQAGLRVLGREEDLARALLHALSDGQRKLAILAAEAPRDVITGPGAAVDLGEPAGIAFRELQPAQQRLLRELVGELADNLCRSVAKQQLREIDDAGWDRVHFAWAGGVDAGQPHYFRITGPTFLVEYDNTQNDANHAHLVWHSQDNDFGADWLRRHYETSPHHAPRATADAP